MKVDLEAQYRLAPRVIPYAQKPASTPRGELCTADPMRRLPERAWQRQIHSRYRLLRVRFTAMAVQCQCESSAIRRQHTVEWSDKAYDKNPIERRGSPRKKSGAARRGVYLRL